MAHNIDQMAYVEAEGQPWHGLGTPVPGVMTAAHALSKGGLDFELEKRPLFSTYQDTTIEVPGKYAVVRKDRGYALGVVGEKYHIVQNYDAFSFFDAVVGENAAVYHTVGSLGRGEKIWILAKLPQEIVVRNQDVSNLFLLLSNSHDGTSAVRVKFTPVRVVCQNTLDAALRGGAEVSIRHTRNADDKLRQAHKLMGIVKEQIEATQQTYNQMDKIRLSKIQADEYLEKVFPINKEAKNQTRRENAVEQVKMLYRTGRGNTGNTLWDLYNGVAEYMDHGRAVHQDSNRWESNAFGSGALIKNRAMEAALQAVASLSV